MATQQPDEQHVFNLARKISDTDARSEYLRQICGANLQLRSRVEALLTAHEKLGFMDVPPAEIATIAQPTTEGPGAVAGHYKLLQRIGEGGFGIVFMAEQQRPVRRTVALKIVKPGMDTREVVARFEAERQALALMNHPNIAHVFDGGVTDSQRPYFVMELVKGVTITEYCDKNDLPTEERLRLFLDLCHAVQHAHQKGVIHRDLKPTNVMITLHDGKPVVKVIDFGVSKAINQRLTERTLFTAYGQMVGTTQYMSPEQAEMSGLDVDTRSDVYSLGVVLYELLTGTTPLDGERLKTAGFAEIRRIIQEEDPPRPSVRIGTTNHEQLTTIAKHRSADPRQLRQLLRGELDWIVMKSLEKDRGRRYQSPSSLAADVQRLLENKPVEACPPSAGYRLRKFLRRNKLAVAMASFVSFTLVAAIVGMTFGFLRQSYLRQAAERAKYEQEVAKTEAQRNAEIARAAAIAEADARRSLQSQSYNLTINAAFEAWQGGSPSRLRELLRSAKSLQSENGLRGFEWQFLQSRLNENAHQQTTLTFKNSITALAFSPNDTYLGLATGNSAVLRNVQTGQETTMTLTGPVTSIAFSPDERYCGVVTNGGAVVRDVQGGSEVTLVAPAGEPMQSHARSVEFLPSGRVLVAGITTIEDTPKNRNQRGWIRGWQIGVNEPLSLREMSFRVSLDYANFGARGAGWDISRDEQTVATLGRDGTIKLWEFPAGDLKTSWKTADWEPRTVSFSPDGAFLVYGGGQSVSLFDPATGDLIKTLRASSFLQAACYFSPDGELLIGTDADGARLWKAAGKIPEGNGEMLTWERGPVHVSQNGSTMAVSRYSGAVVHLFDGSTRRRMAMLSHAGLSLSALSHDGQRVATGSRDGSLRLWNVNSLRATSCSGDVNPLVVFAVSPDGRNVGTSTADARIRLWDTRTGSSRLLPAANGELLGNHEFVHSVAFSSDGAMVAATHRDGVVRIWNTATGRIMTILDHSAGRVVSDDLINPAQIIGWNGSSLAFSPDGQFLAIWGNTSNNVQLWETKTWRTVTEIHQPGMSAFGFSKDGRQLAIAGGGLVRVWNMERAVKGQSSDWQVPFANEAFCCDFSPDGSALVVGSMFVAEASKGVPGWHNTTTASVTVFSTVTREEVFTLRREGAWLSFAAVSPDASCIVTASLAGEISFWRTSTGEPLGTIRLDEGVRKVAFFPNGDLVSASMNGTLRIWRVYPGEEAP